MIHRHYFTDNDDLEQKRKEISFRFSSLNYTFTTDSGVFSKNSIDYGSKFLVETLSNYSKKSLLDIGCGYGFIGIVLGKYWNIEVDFSDVSKQAVELTKHNLIQNSIVGKVSHGNLFEGISKKYECIVVNPPIRAGKKVIYQLFENAKSYLLPDGELWIVIRKQHGAESAIKFLAQHYKNVKKVAQSNGFWVICAK